MEVDIQRIQNVVNQVYPGIAMLVRDVNLPDSFVNKYIPGMIIREKAFTDASCRVNGCKLSCQGNDYKTSVYNSVKSYAQLSSI